MPYQCWQCGRRVPAIVRTNVFTGWSIGRGGPRAYSHRVNLCPDCVAARKRRRLRSLLLIPAAILAFFLVTLIIAVVQVATR